ncbi:MIP family Ig-specific serine endopeptidase [Mycoplasmopsis sturni]|uniref:MIP family Ig-specific serine endopeptidase n=1 Tax=Mycoplasmopsis sturni TaxID=39047 RepID=UPI00056D2DA7|nr:hypothetical protein [Mycoplasmopsis sturni]
MKKTLKKALLSIFLIASSTSVLFSCTEPTIKQDAETTNSVVDKDKNKDFDNRTSSETLNTKNTKEENPKTQENYVKPSEKSELNSNIQPLLPEEKPVIVPTEAKFELSKSSDDTKLSTNKDYLSSLNKRTFSLSAIFNEKENGHWTSPIIFRSGTIWLLDYKVIEVNSKKEHLKLFFASNFHVLSKYANKNDYPEYYQKNLLEKESLVEYTLTKAKEVIPISNKNSIFNSNWYSVSFRNDPDIEKTTFKNFFIARNFFNENFDIAPSTHPSYKKNYYADFAVMEVDIDLKEIARNKKNGKQLRNNLLDAIDEVNKSIEKIQNNNLINNNGKIPYYTLDFSTVSKISQDLQNTSFNKSFYLNNYLKNYLYNTKPENTYILGYPQDSNNNIYQFKNWEPEQWKTYGIKRDSKSTYPYYVEPNFQVSPEFHLQGINEDLSFDTEVQNKFYGFTYKIDSQILAEHGASGSLVVDEQNLPFGLLFGYIQEPHSILLKSQKDPKKLIRKEYWTLLLQPLSQNIRVITDQGVVEPFNLIDSRDKKLYPNQKVSYQSRLETVFGHDWQTAIFGGETLKIEP